MEQWAAVIAAPGKQLWVRCLAQGSHLSRGHFLPEPGCSVKCTVWCSVNLELEIYLVWCSVNLELEIYLVWCSVNLELEIYCTAKDFIYILNELLFLCFSF